MKQQLLDAPPAIIKRDSHCMRISAGKTSSYLIFLCLLTEGASTAYAAVKSSSASTPAPNNGGVAPGQDSGVTPSDFIENPFPVYLVSMQQCGQPNSVEGLPLQLFPSMTTSNGAQPENDGHAYSLHFSFPMPPLNSSQNQMRLKIQFVDWKKKTVVEEPLLNSIISHPLPSSQVINFELGSSQLTCFACLLTVETVTDPSACFVAFFTTNFDTPRGSGGPDEPPIGSSGGILVGNPATNTMPGGFGATPSCGSLTIERTTNLSLSWLILLALAGAGIWLLRRRRLQALRVESFKRSTGKNCIFS